MRKKWLMWLVGVCLFEIIVCKLQNVEGAYKRDGIDSFPNSYQPYLIELQKRYPNWHFTALYTDLEWNDVINAENKFGVNLVPKSYSDRWKNTNEGEYNIDVDLGWVDSSRRAVEYAMDPRNFLNYIRIFQFEELSYDERTNNLIGIEKILYGTEFYNRVVQYITNTGEVVTMDKKYSDLILDAAKISGVSSYHLASRIKQEVGPFLSHSSISGTVVGFEGLYNFYNIGATSSTENLGAIKNGLKYARDGKGASTATKIRYLIPWNTKERAITGGAIFIGSSYINKGQNSLYLQKFHVNSNTGGSLFWHQYMTNVLAPYGEAKSIYNGYVNTGLLDTGMSFIIPVYENMPEYPTENPNILESDFTSDNTKVYANVSSVLNVRSGPSTSYEMLTVVSKSDIMTRIAIGKQAGELWDKVKLQNGIVGYVFHNYLVEIPAYIEVPGMRVSSSLKVLGDYVTGWRNDVITVKNIFDNINTDFNVSVYNYNGVKLQNSDRVGTGAKIRLSDNNGVIRAQYEVILYGDLNGDGYIDSIDLLILQRHILQIELLGRSFFYCGEYKEKWR